jgi:hypothetical protein
MRVSRGIRHFALLALFGVAPLSGCWLSYNNPTTLTLAVADTPVDGAESVSVAFTGVQVQGSTGAPLDYNYSVPLQLNLLQFQDDDFALLLDRVNVPAGKYRSIRLKVDISRSSITLADGSVHPLVIPPGGDATGFSVTGGFTIAANEHTAIVVDFDLRKSIALASGAYDFTPSLRLVDINQAGALEGIVAPGLILGGVAISNPTCSPAAYVYSGANVTPADIDLSSAVGPVQTTDVSFDSVSGNYHYGFDYLPSGNYTVALVCAAGDDPATADSLGFSAHKNAMVAAGNLTRMDFP